MEIGFMKLEIASYEDFKDKIIVYPRLRSRFLHTTNTLHFYSSSKIDFTIYWDKISYERWSYMAQMNDFKSLKSEFFIEKDNPYIRSSMIFFMALTKNQFVKWKLVSND